MSDPIEVIPISTPIRLGHDDIPGVISAVCLRGSGSPRVTYEVTYWDGGVRCQEWVDSEEIKVDERRSTTTIGFRLAPGSANGKGASR